MEDALIAVLGASAAVPDQTVFPHALEQFCSVIRERIQDVACSRHYCVLRYESSLSQSPHSPVQRIASAFITVQFHELE
jgi:hypothetical protein